MRVRWLQVRSLWFVFRQRAATHRKISRRPTTVQRSQWSVFGERAAVHRRKISRKFPQCSRVTGYSTTEFRYLCVSFVFPAQESEEASLQFLRSPRTPATSQACNGVCSVWLVYVCGPTVFPIDLYGYSVHLQTVMFFFLSDFLILLVSYFVQSSQVSVTDTN